MKLHLQVFSLILILSFVTGCQKKDALPNEDTFVYTFMSQHAAFSLKFNASDTVYMKSYMGTESESYALLKNRDSLEALIREVDFAKYDTLYDSKQTALENPSIRFYSRKGDSVQKVTLINDGPEALYKTAIRFNELAVKLKFSPYEGRQDYGTQGGMVAPPPIEIQEAPKNIVK